MRPFLIRQRSSWRPLFVGDCRGHEDVAARTSEQISGADRGVDGRGVLGPIVQDQRYEASRESEATRLELGAQCRWLVREEPRSAELRGGETERGHLVEDARNGQHVAPTRYLADAPRDRR